VVAFGLLMFIGIGALFLFWPHLVPLRRDLFFDAARFGFVLGGAAASLVSRSRSPLAVQIISEYP
jgi:hypothetical protein